MLGFVIAMTLLVAGSWSQARQKKKNNSCGSLCSEIQTLKKTIADLSKQVMLQQLYAEERYVGFSSLCHIYRKVSFLVKTIKRLQLFLTQSLSV